MPLEQSAMVDAPISSIAWDESPISYAPHHEAWELFPRLVRELASQTGVRRICDVGGGANPFLPLPFVQERNLEYTILDISADELAKAPNGYQKVQADIAARDFDHTGRYDLIFSKMLAEHIEDARQFHTNVRSILADGGVAFHFFPTLYTPPFVAKRLLPHALTQRILAKAQPDRDYEYAEGKFPAYYRWCRGPAKRQIRRFESLGYTVRQYKGFFGTGYYARLGPLARFDEWVSAKLMLRPIPALTSYAHILLEKS